MKKIEISKEFLIQEYTVNRKTGEEIANELGLNKCTVLRRIKDYGIELISKNIEKEELEQLYLVDKLSCKKIAKKYGYCASHISNLLTKYEIPRRQYRNLYNHNDSFFKIPNIENCYWAGFIAADGCIAKAYKTHTEYLTIALKSTDENVLYALKEACKYTGPITHRTVNGQGKYSENTYYSSWLSIRRCPKIIEDLKNNFNITSAKSLTLEPPNLVDLDLQLAFITGLIDGDGHIGIHNNVLKFELVGTKAIIGWASHVLHKLESNEYSEMNVYSKPTQKCFYINCTWTRAYNLLKQLQQIPVPFRLARKWDKIKEYESTL